MEQIALKAEKRNISSKGGINGLRRNGKLPGVLYGKNIDSSPVTVDAKELMKILKNHGESALINLELEGRTHPVLMKEIQRDTFKDAIVHVDFYGISMTEKIEFDLPIILKGDAEGVKMGGILQHQKREISVKALPKDLPEHLEVDISDLKIGDTLTVGDLKVDEKLTVLDDPEEVVISILAPKLAEDTGVPTGQQAAEPEVVAKGKEKKEEE
ncbi:MAG: 50S ribosomal protein L25/general stress protein Ctc [Tepidanaerobacteraceae bacterium]|jgi:large subunit ribosomal protein L25|nr:50S ribosomal protein L25/general stress protein Ctc [Tepidanaerobacteraceae bacterium]